MPDKDLNVLIKSLQQAADENDAAAIAAIEKAYTKMYGKISDKLELIIRRLLKEGAVLTEQKIREALREFEEVTAEELTKFSGFLENSIPTWATASLIFAGGQALELMGNFTNKELQSIDFANLPPSALDVMLSFVAEGSPLYERINMMSPFYTDKITTALVDAIQQGWNPRKTAAEVEKFIQGTLYTADGIFANPLADALRMTRTAQLWANREATLAQFNANSDVVKGWVWFATLDEVCCMSCVAQHGTIHGLDEVLDDHHNGRCLVPGTLVSSPSVTAFVSRMYNGKVVTIRTASGKFLTVTPNHPILTDRGFISAGAIQKSDNVISDGRSDWASFGIDPNKHHVPTLIEDVPAALLMNDFIFVPSTSEDFHGDGMDSDVYVIRTNRLLRNSVNPPFGKPLTQKGFGGRDAKSNLLSGKCNFHSVYECMLNSNNSFLSNSNTSQKFTLGGIRNNESVGGSVIAQDNAGPFKPAGYGTSIDARITCESVEGFSIGIALNKFINRDREGLIHSNGRVFGGNEFVSLGFVSKNPISLDGIRNSLGASVVSGADSLNGVTSNVILDGVIDVTFSSYYGHVYNLQTKEGWYISNGIITHNCAPLPYLGEDNPITETGVEWFEKQSEERQTDLMGKAAYNAWKDGAITLDQLSAQYTDDVFGVMRGEASLVSILGEDAQKYYVKGK